MYNRKLETSAEAHAIHIANLKRQSAERLKVVAAKVKLKKSQKSS